MSKINFKRLFVIAATMSLFISYAGIWIRLINDQTQRTGSDFIHFYTAGRIAQTHGADAVYDLALQHDVEEEVVGFPLADFQVLPYNHLPFLIPILRTVISTEYVESFYRWDLLMVLFFMAGISITGNILLKSGVERRSILIASIGGMLFLPFFFSLMNGQDTALLWLGTVIWAYGLVSGRPILAGMGLSITTVRPHISLVLALPMFFSYRRVFWGYLFGTGILGSLCLIILGVQGVQKFINVLLISMGGEWYGIKPYAMYNFIGLVTRLIPFLEAETIRLLGWILYALSILGVIFLWMRNKGEHGTLIGWTVIIALFTVPHLNFHDLTLLLVPIYELIRSEKTRTTVAVISPLLVSILLLVGNISFYLQYSLPYLIMLALAWFPFYMRDKAILTAQHQSQLPEK